MSTPSRIELPPTNPGTPDFDNLLAVLRQQHPSRPTLFEFFLNGPLYDRLAGAPLPDGADVFAAARRTILAFRNAGYDYATAGFPNFGFAAAEAAREQTRSINDGAVITDRKSFDAYQWPDPEEIDATYLDTIAESLTKGMKLVVNGPGGVLENAIRLVGYETLCYLIIDNEQIAYDIFEGVGSRLVQYYRKAVRSAATGAIIGNDDWGFKSQTMLSPADMRRFVFPWHKELVAVTHAAGIPAILHSCGNLTHVMDDVIDDIGYNGKHSYEDTIQPVEEAYEQYHERIGIMGGIDVDFVVRGEPQAIYERSKAMVERSAARGSYALGTGNSVPEYVPQTNYFAMINAAVDARD